MLKKLVEEYNETHGKITIDFDRTSDGEDKFTIEATYVSDYDTANAIKGLVHKLANSSGRTPLEVIASIQYVLLEHEIVKLQREEDDE